jgi:hypothetical protein
MANRLTTEEISDLLVQRREKMKFELKGAKSVELTDDEIGTIVDGRIGKMKEGLDASTPTKLSTEELGELIVDRADILEAHVGLLVRRFVDGIKERARTVPSAADELTMDHLMRHLTAQQPTDEPDTGYVAIERSGWRDDIEASLGSRTTSSVANFSTTWKKAPDQPIIGFT